jgi:hypothetical protein
MMMTEWSAERRAQWLYNNQTNIAHDAYMRGLQDAEVRRRVEEMNARGVIRNPNYIDPELRDDPGIMYNIQDNIPDSGGPASISEDSTNSSGSAFIWVITVIVVVAVAFVGFHLVFVKRY